MLDRDAVKVLLHHREPYLMVDRVDALTPETVTGVKVHRGDEPYLQAHFPRAPIVPGAMLQELCTQSAGVLITKHHAPVENYDSEKTKGHALGVLSKVEYAKYLGIVKTDRDVVAEVQLVEQLGPLFKFNARVYQDGTLKAKLCFKLTNIGDEHLF
ncbi:MAG: 3-hydroxyacyl-[acyl-carrier-protein] dehydratase [Planctomycetota bacterium]|jgi:3-hydroxyacyl-[acyl-carrier-protein] dehydratase